MVRSRPFGAATTLPSGRYRARYSEHGRLNAAPSTLSTKADARTRPASGETPTLAALIDYDPNFSPTAPPG